MYESVYATGIELLGSSVTIAIGGALEPTKVDPMGSRNCVDDWAGRPPASIPGRPALLRRAAFFGLVTFRRRRCSCSADSM
jgi:hypothetical protein